MARQMKDSGIAWIGEIPEQWDTRKGKWILEHLERPVLPDDGVITCFRDGEVTLRSNRREDGFTFSLQEAGYQGIEPGDLVVHGMDGFAGAIGISDSRGKGTPVLNVLDSSENKKYLTYYLRTMAHNGIFLALSTGIRVRSCDTNWNKLKELQYILPPSDEQDRIADFLDCRCAEIDAVIERTKVTIEEYKKLKQAVITEAVTKGVRGPRKMKDSGIEWIGEIPEGWEVVKATRLIVSTQNGLTRRDLDKSNGQIVLKLKNITAFGQLDYTEINRIQLTEKELETYQLSDGDFLFVRVNGSKNLVGKCAIYQDISEPVAYNDHIIRVRLNEWCNKLYFQWFLLSDSGKVEIDLHTSTAAGQYTISGEGLRDLHIVILPQVEQDEIL